MSRAGDPVSLPPVPPPAPDSHPLRDRVLVAAFVAALALPGLLTIKNASRTMTAFENRPTAAWPDSSAGAAFQGRFEQAFSDRFGGRGALIALHHSALVRLFGVSPVDKVMLGDSGWLFFLGEDAHSLDRHYRGVMPMPDDIVAAVLAELKRRNDYLHAHGIAYVVTIAPDKFTIYPEHLPSWVRHMPAPTPFARLADALHADGSVRFVDLRKPLLEAKKTEQVYFKTDSHWNLLGARIAASLLMREVQAALPPGRLPNIELPENPPYVPNVDFYSGDLAKMLGLPKRFEEPDLAPLGKLFAEQANICARRVENAEGPDVETYACGRGDLPRAVMYRDSMAIPLVPLISPNFSRIVYVSSRKM
ncbi:MAG TPA: hypothetical protein VMV45_15935, partial [Casimicrobiaceae bacterium]|nr:hypothetical protein [Casimicrobiaceae bacterium]